MKVQMALDTPSEASTVAQGSILAQCRSELGKFPKVFGVQSQPVGMGGKECEKCNVRYCDLQVKHLLPLFTEMVVGLIVLPGLLLWEARHVQPEGEFWEVPILVLLWHHGLFINVLVEDVQYLADIRGNAGVVGAVADK